MVCASEGEYNYPKATYEVTGYTVGGTRNGTAFETVARPGPGQVSLWGTPIERRVAHEGSRGSGRRAAQAGKSRREWITRCTRTTERERTLVMAKMRLVSSPAEQSTIPGGIVVAVMGQHVLPPQVVEIASAKEAAAAFEIYREKVAGPARAPR